MTQSPKTASNPGSLRRCRWLATACVVAGSLAAVMSVGCAVQQNTPVIPEIEPAGSVPAGEEPAVVDPDGDDAADAAR